MTVPTVPFRATPDSTPIYMIRATTPWPPLTESTEWTDNSPFDVTFTTYDQVASGVEMRVPVCVTQHRRTTRNLNRPNSEPEYEFIGMATFNDSSVMKVNGTVQLTMDRSDGTGTFDDLSS